MTRTKDFDKDNCLLLLGSVLLFFAVLELALALFWPHKVISRPYHEQYHPVMGWVNKPHMAGPVKVFGSRNVLFQRTHNSRGLRSLREFAPVKPADVRRVLLLGDSFFWGYGVDDREVLSEVLQGMVGRDVEVINGAVMAYATDQELLWLTEEGMRYRPDLVVLGVFPANDLEDIGVSVMMGYPKPFFSLRDGKLRLENVPVPDTRETRRKAFDEPDTSLGKLKKFLRHHTHTYPFIAGRLNAVPSIRRFLLRTGLADEYTAALPGIPLIKLNEDKALGLFAALVAEIRNVCDKADAGLLIVHIPRKEQDGRSRPHAYTGVDAGAAAANARMSAYLGGIAARNAIPYLDLLPVVRSRQEREELLYVPGGYDHHWTPLGHRIAAEALFAWMSANGWTGK